MSVKIELDEVDALVVGTVLRSLAHRGDGDTKSREAMQRVGQLLIGAFYAVTTPDVPARDAKKTDTEVMSRTACRTERECGARRHQVAREDGKCTCGIRVVDWQRRVEYLADVTSCHGSACTCSLCQELLQC